MKTIISFLILFLFIALGWFYARPVATEINTNMLYRIEAPEKSSVSDAALTKNYYSSAATQAPVEVTKSIYYPEKFSADGSPLPLLERRREYSRKEIQDMLKTPEERLQDASTTEKVFLSPSDQVNVYLHPTMDFSSALEKQQRDWWFQYSRQVPQLLLKGTCPGLSSHPDIEKLKQMADSGDKCAMGNYAIAMLVVLGREYAPHDAEKMASLRSRIKPLFEYLGQSTGFHPMVAGPRSCASTIYFNDRDEAIAWEMIEVAYYTRDVYYLMGDCNSFLTPPDDEETYQRALALALFYVDYYQLDK